MPSFSHWCSPLPSAPLEKKKKKNTSTYLPLPSLEKEHMPCAVHCPFHTDSCITSRAGVSPAFDGKLTVKLQTYQGDSEEAEVVVPAGGALAPGGTAVVVGGLKSPDSYVHTVVVKAVGGSLRACMRACMTASPMRLTTCTARR